MDLAEDALDDDDRGPEQGDEDVNDPGAAANDDDDDAQQQMMQVAGDEEVNVAALAVGPVVDHDGGRGAATGVAARAAAAVKAATAATQVAAAAAASANGVSAASAAHQTSSPIFAHTRVFGFQLKFLRQRLQNWGVLPHADASDTVSQHIEALCAHCDTFVGAFHIFVPRLGRHCWMRADRYM